MDDLIKRSDAIKALCDAVDNKGNYEGEWLYTDEFCKAIGSVPSADRPQGTDFDEWYKLMEIFYNEGVADAWDIAQTVFGSTLTLNEAKDVYRQMKGADDEASD